MAFCGELAIVPEPYLVLTLFTSGLRVIRPTTREATGQFALQKISKTCLVVRYNNKLQ